MSTVPSLLRSTPQRTRSDVSLAGSTRPNASTPDDPMKMLKILEALQKGDLNALTTLLPTYRGAASFPVANTPGGTVSSTQSFDGPPQGSQTTPVHLAVQCAQFPVIEYVLNNTPQVDLNARDHHGYTALHLASSMGRLDVVKLLLSKNDVNDGILDHKGKSAFDVASTPEVRVVLKAHRTEYLSHATTLMHQFAESGDLASLIGLFDHPRASFVLNISHQDTETGSTILHSASRRKDMSMVQWCLDQGIDTLLRDKKGKTAADVTKDTKIKNLLRDSRSTGTIAPLIATTPGQPPRLEGTLFKWTNYATGYKARWFVLEDGILSYFHNQEDAGNACRGSINLRIAKVWIDSTDKQRFDIIGKGSIRYHLKAGHANEAKRWILALTQSKQWIEDTAANDRPSFIGSRPSLQLQASDSIRSKLSEPSMSRGRSTTTDGSESIRPQRSRSSSVSIDGREQNSLPHAESFVTMNNYVQTQIQMQTEMSENLIRLSRAAEIPEDSEIMKLTLATHETSIAIKSSVQKLHEMTKDREDYWKRILEQESQKRELWEESLKVLSEEQLEMQRILKQTEESNRKMKKSRSVRSKASTPTLMTATSIASTIAAPPGQATESATPVSASAPTDMTPNPPRASNDGPVPVDGVEDDSDAESEDEFFDAASDDDIVEFDQDEEDEEVIETVGNENEGPVQANITATEGSTDPYIAPSFMGYPTELRTRLPTKQTSLRPDVSLWAILKNSIGKDLSKITLPVYFNEPTSMLQRMAEDAEYIELLDKAVRQRGATERILFIAAFAMSNYSSTIGRVAKPFNPLLGETYEYTHKEKQFRYISEQVSHHPPISACYCDSPNYNFYAEVDVKSKFWGKSFEVMPKGTSHVELKVPKAFAEGSQELLDDPNDPSRFIEHYSWRKVTTCVQNLIVGTPWIDNYGDMVITNHRTGETCLLTFKARGWRGKDAYEIRGHALDARGKEVWEVAGRWNERLVARRAGKGGEDLGSDAVAAGAVQVAEDDQGELGRACSPATSQHGKSRSGAASFGPKQVLLLWKRDPVSGPTPFNLTPFAMTLNDCPEELKKHLCPTDSRLRPDQRAMENAEFDLANTEKQRLEEKQRAKRKLLPPGKEFEPRWFKRNAQDDGWDFVGRDLPGQPKGTGMQQAGRLTYWAERERCGATAERPEQLKWDLEDDDIF
ncbi:oxysterol-binding protein 1 [Entomortierella parvispora]|uniref:Oxysterol-binding protein 1 n=1 Tax=Entomortierella parvispora TaxID=205924 RepID=A0A9P3HB68_9FUNG|nr:oxysterol-binding protein 1 [Entomortierella parvispora]